MIHILIEVYMLRQQVKGYSLVHSTTLPGLDHIAIYKKADVCVLAFTGSNDRVDWVQNFNGVVTHNLCHDSFRVHSGMLQETMQALNHENFTSTFAPYLGNAHECP